MSAIFGILYPEGVLADLNQLQTMEKGLSHYGPDAQETYHYLNVGLGCCLSKSGKYTREDIPIYQNTSHQYLLIGDALIYNREVLMTECQFSKQSQVSTQQLLLEAYLRWGMDCPNHINGDFAFAIWDKKLKCLTLVRDHLGVRPLYYFYHHSTFAFATDYRALLALPFVGKEPDDLILYAALSDTYHIDTESTFFARIKRLPQAHILQITNRGLHMNKYWTPGSGKKIRYRQEEHYSKALYAIVRDSIKLRLDYTEGKVASEFSAGLDSSVVTILTSRLLNKKEQSLEAYSWSPSYNLLEKQEIDERDWIHTVCEQEGFPCRLRNVYLTPEQSLLCKPVLTDGQRSDEVRPVLNEITSGGARFVMSGWGGDEGISHRADLSELLLCGDMIHFIKEVSDQSGGSPLHFIKILLSAPVTLLFRPYSIFGSQNNQIPSILNKTFAKSMKKHCKKDVLHMKTNPVRHMESGVSVSRTEIGAWLGADYSLQYLFPFLDYRVVDFALSIPRHFYYKHGLSRYIYRKAFEAILPKELCYNTSKTDIARNVHWKNTENLQKKAELIMKQMPKEMFSSYLDWEKVQELVEQQYFKENTRDGLLTLFKLQTCYDLWRMLEEIKEN